MNPTWLNLNEKSSHVYIIFALLWDEDKRRHMYFITLKLETQSNQKKTANKTD